MIAAFQSANVTNYVAHNTECGPNEIIAFNCTIKMEFPVNLLTCRNNCVAFTSKGDVRLNICLNVF